LFALLVVTAFVAGSYPAFFLSGLKPVKVLKGQLKFKWSATIVRKGTGGVPVFALHFFHCGYDRYIPAGRLYSVEEHRVFPREPHLRADRREAYSDYALFRQEASRHPEILSVSKMRNTPTVIGHHTSSIDWAGKDPNQSVSFADGVVGYDFVKTMKLELLKGRDFSREFGIDSASYILNETAVNKMGLHEPVGETISWGNRKGKVIGVLKDFHFNSMHQAIDPLIFRLDENWPWGTILVRTKAGNTREALASLEKICKSLNPKFPFTYQFSDQEYAKLYNNEQVVTKLANYFAFLAIFISCLGLFGLATFTAEQRVKEIGIRKVLGASVAMITRQLSAGFLKPVAVALLIAFPASWYAMNYWLQGYVYKVGIEWWIFAIAGLLTICIALLTVSYQSIRSALINPVMSLRTE
jgi:hypothetical protein